MTGAPRRSPGAGRSPPARAAPRAAQGGRAELGERHDTATTRHLAPATGSPAPPRRRAMLPGGAMRDTNLVLFEGLPGSGKSTSGQRLALQLDRLGIPA